MIPFECIGSHQIFSFIYFFLSFFHSGVLVQWRFPRFVQFDRHIWMFIQNTNWLYGPLRKLRSKRFNGMLNRQQTVSNQISNSKEFQSIFVRPNCDGNFVTQFKFHHSSYLPNFLFVACIYCMHVVVCSFFLSCFLWQWLLYDVYKSMDFICIESIKAISWAFFKFRLKANTTLNIMYFHLYIYKNFAYYCCYYY